MRLLALLIAASALGCSPQQAASGQQPSKQPPAPAQTAASGAPGTGAIRIPLVTGLTISTAIVMDGFGDGESVKQITSIDENGVSLRYSADVPDTGVAGLVGGKKPGKVRHVRGRRTVARDDLATAREYMYVFGQTLPERIPGSTALGVSAAVLDDLKTRGESELTIRGSGLGTALGSLIGAFAGSEFSGIKEIRDLDQIDKVAGTIRRAGSTSLRVLVNGKPADLPAIRARGQFEDRTADFHFLDDSKNPLALKWTIGDDRLQVVAIAFPETADTAAASSIAADLAEKGRAEVYGIYFDFDSATIRPESTPVLEEIARVMREHPEWPLNVEGHTDNVGTDQHNLELSRRRAAAVIDTLAGEHGVGRARLSPAGYGASRPKDTNDTIEGRARNRRVELVRK